MGAKARTTMPQQVPPTSEPDQANDQPYQFDEPWFEALVEQYMPASLAHGRDHVFRVVAWCKVLVNEIRSEDGSSIDDGALLAAAYLHDLGRIERLEPLVDIVPDPEAPHAARSAAFAEAILSGILHCPDELVATIGRIILAHSFSGGETPATIEEAILADADRLDALGGEGVVRTVAYSVENGRTLQDTVDHLRDKILTLAGLMHTGAAKRIAEKKHDIVQQVYDDLLDDLDLQARRSSISSK
jgi:uncharacterized protein